MILHAAAQVGPFVPFRLKKREPPFGLKHARASVHRALSTRGRMTRQRDNARGRYFCAPPENAATFHELFLFIWEHGVGNTLAGAGGPGVKWTRESLAIALNEAASPRSIDDWRSGARVPSDTNVRALISVVADAPTRGEWQRALIRAAAEGREKTRQNGDEGHQESRAIQPDTGAADGPPPIAASTAKINRPIAWILGVTAAVALIAVFAILAVPDYRPVDHTRLSVGERFRDPFLSRRARAPEMVLLPRGMFVMGSLRTDPGREANEDQRHSVHIDYRLAVSVHEVTWDEYQLCVDAGACGGYLPDDEGWGRGDQPVININFNDVYAYLHWLNGELGIAWSREDRYTLLTEAEWEYAALAGSQGGTFHPYAFGPTISADVANYAGGASSPGRPLAVGSYAANAWGLHDMHGNVWEWAEDCYRDRHTALPNDGRAWLTPHCLPGARRIQKGGSFADPMTELRASNRRAALPEERRSDVGFRLARRLDGQNWDVARPEN